mgnify:FL=1
MAGFTKKIRLILTGALFFGILVSEHLSAARLGYLEQMPLEAFAKLREIERYQLKIAEKFYISGDYKAAASEYEKFLTLYERSAGGPYSLLMWSHCQVKLRLVNTAVREGFKSVIDYWPESNEAILSTFMIGNCHLLQGEPKKAEKVFDSVVIDYPKHYLATLAQVELLGIAATRKDEERQVELWTSIAFRTAKTKATATHRSMASRSLAMYYFREGEFPQGVEALSVYFEKDNGGFVRYTHEIGASAVGQLFRTDATKARATKLAGQVISFLEERLPADVSRDKSKAQARDVLGRIASIHKTIDRDKEVIAAYERMGKILGMDDGVLGEIAAWHKSKKRMEQARSVYGRYADKVNGRRAVAGSFREEKKYEEAVRHYLALIGLDKEREATWQQDVVSTWRDSSQWDKAIATYRTLLTVDPDRHSDWNWGIAECYEKKRQWPQAIQSYRQTDNYPEGYFRMAECNRHLKKWTEGLVLLNQAKSHENVADRAQHRIAQFYELAGKKENAIKSFQITCKKYPKSRYASISHAHLQTKYGISVTLGGATDK